MGDGFRGHIKFSLVDADLQGSKRDKQAFIE
jgi:hypothetical protein